MLNSMPGSPSARRTRRSGFTLVELLTMTAMIVLLISLLLPAIQSAREAARRTQCKNHLMQIGLALNNYMMAHGVLPPGSQNETGPITSVPNSGYHMGWITQILPFFEQQNAYRRIDFTKSIYDKINDNASTMILSELNCPSSWSAPTNGTCYRGVHHDFEAPIDVNQNGVLFLNSSINEEQISDGVSHTAYVMESVIGSAGTLSWASGTRASLSNAVIRTLPQPDASTDPDARTLKPMYELHPSTKSSGYGNSLREELSRLESTEEFVGGPSSAHTGLFNVAMGDGAVRSISNSIDAKVLRNMAHRADGELPPE